MSAIERSFYCGSEQERIDDVFREITTPFPVAMVETRNTSLVAWGVGTGKLSADYADYEDYH